MQNIIGVYVLSLILAFVSSAQARGTFEDQSYDVIDTHLVQQNDYPARGVWLDDENIIINTHELVKDEVGKWGEENNAVIYNVETRKKTLIASHGRIDDYDDENYVACVWMDGSGNRKVRLVIPGRPVSLQGKIPLESYVCPFERPTEYSRALKYLRRGDGYIDLGDKVNGSPRNNAVLVRPGRGTLELPIPSAHIKFITYVPFMNKYLLNHDDYRMSLGESERPFWLMSPEGEVFEIPYPKKLVADVFNGGNFNRIVPLKSGTLVARTGIGGRGEKGFFLLKGSRVIRIWGNGRDFANNYMPSPNGCMLAFLSYKNKWFGRTAETVKIINVCKDEK